MLRLSVLAPIIFFLFTFAPYFTPCEIYAQGNRLESTGNSELDDIIKGFDDQPSTVLKKKRA